MRSETLSTKQGDIIVTELRSCVIARVMVSAIRNIQFDEKQADHLRYRFMMWLDSGVFDPNQWLKTSKTFGDYRFSAFVKGRSSAN